MDRLSWKGILEAAMAQEEVDVEEWGGSVLVRAISTKEHEDAERMATRRGDVSRVKYLAFICASGMLDPKVPKGEEIKLMNKEPGILARISERILELSGIDMGEEEDDQGEE